jgi:hypothetical protein
MYVNGTGCPEGNKCLNSHRYKWDENLRINKDRCYVCGLQQSKATKNNQPHRSNYCNAPGGGVEHESIQDRVNLWIRKELPLRPGKVKTSIPKEEDRRRSKSPTRRRTQEKENEMHAKGLTAWDIGEIEEIQRQKLMKTLRSARRESTD